MPSKAKRHNYKTHIIEEYYITEEPFYLPLKDEIDLFEAAYSEKIPVLLKGPTGCGKTRFLEYMTYRMSRKLFGDNASAHSGRPAITTEFLSLPSPAMRTSRPAIWWANICWRVIPRAGLTAR